MNASDTPELRGLHLWRRIAPFWRSLVLMAVCLLAQTLYWVATPLILSNLIDEGLIERQRSALGHAVGLLVAVLVVGQVGGVLFDWVAARVLSEVLRRLRDDMFRQLQRLSLGYFSRHTEGDIVARFSGDAATVEEVTSAFIPWVVMPGLAVVAATFALFELDWRLALLAMLVWPSSLLGPRLSAHRAMRASVAKREREATALGHVQENVAAQPVVKAFELRDHSIDRFGRVNTDLAGLSRRMHFLSALVDRSSSLGNAALQILVLALSAWMAFNGDLTIGEVTAFQTLFLLLGTNVDYVMQYLPTLVRSSGSLRSIDGLLREHADVADRPDAAAVVRFERDLCLDGVTFGYEADRPVLRDVSLTVPKGKYVAFVGPSGSGKSTVLGLLMRMYDPQQGAVRVDGVDIRDIRQDVYRSLIAPVLQESFLFNTTVRENIRLGRLSATDAEVEAAAQAAEIHEAILRMPDGYDTEVGPRGGRLSGGQRQRVAIARAILRNPAVLVLDEATSALDAATEAAINGTLFHIAQHRTVVSVTHRLASVAHYDEIFVFADGRLVEQGTHDELYRAGGVYTELWDKQSGFTISQHGDRAAVTAQRLGAIPIFSGLDPELLSDLADDFVSERMAAGRTVVEQGDPADKFYVIARGAVRAVRRAEDGAVVAATVLQDGDFFGEVGLLRDVPRLASVTTLGESTFLTLTRERFLRLLERAPELRRRLEREYPADAPGAAEGGRSPSSEGSEAP